MALEPATKRAIAFFDGQNLFHHAKSAFGYSFPNFDPHVLAMEVCRMKGWGLSGIFFYTGLPDAKDDPSWNHFWNAKLAVMGTRGIKTFSRKLRYHNQSVVLPNGTTATTRVGHEKGIDVRIALDIVGYALDGIYDVALVFSQDQDLSEAIDDVKRISLKDNRWLKIACAFPSSPKATNSRGINGTDWIPFDKALYDKCLDTNDYRRKSNRPPDSK